MQAITRIKQTGLTASQLARAVGCTPHTIRNYETGRRFPSREQIAQLVNVASEQGVELLASDLIKGGRQ